MIREERGEGKKIPRLAGAWNFPGFSPSIHGEIRGGAKKRMKLLLKILFQPVEIHSATLNIHFQTAFEGINGGRCTKISRTNIGERWDEHDRKVERRKGQEGNATSR